MILNHKGNKIGHKDTMKKIQYKGAPRNISFVEI